MTGQQLNYERIASAIRFIKENRREQPKLEEVAEHVHMSPYHFQRTFQEWAGTSPKHFLQYLNVEYAKLILQETHASLFDTACEVGLSGTGRLYDLFVNIEGMTPGEYKNGGENLTIHYSFAESPFGEIFVASTDKGICCLEFTDNHPASIDNLKRKFPNAKYKQIVDGLQQNALFIFTQDWSKLKEIKLHLKGTDFQLKVLPTESMGSIAQNTDGRTDHLRGHCCRYQSPEGLPGGRDCRGRKSRGSPDSLPPCHPFHRRIGQLPLGRCPQDRHYRVGSRKEKSR